jgi:Cu-Zn family superoxide dismutase
MMKLNSTVLCAGLALWGLVAAVGCGSDKDDAEQGVMLASSQDSPVFRYVDPYAPMMAGTPNPIANTASATAEAFDEDGHLRIELNVAGFPATRPFGSHLHKLACDDDLKAGGHYQNMPVPMGGSTMDPVYANNKNEAWLDFTTDAAGNGQTILTVDWIPRSGEAKAIIFHDMPSGIGGASGPKLACLPITGF